ncbi:MAG TPA: lipoprotein [Pseudomonadales bacterium]|nr:lipoprotein [Pseudomonadales bacterium]
MRPIIAIPLLILLLSACGQTGPLYLPDHEPNSKAADKPAAEADQNAVEAPAPAKQEGL